jgi:hypothetical protein
MKNWPPSELERKAAVETGKAVVANIKTDKRLIEWAKSKRLYVLIGRPSIWGNPYVIGKDGTREEVVEKYRSWLWQPEQTELRRQLPELRGKVLGCWCYPEACHGGVLIAAVASAGISTVDAPSIAGWETDNPE